MAHLVRVSVNRIREGHGRQPLKFDYDCITEAKNNARWMLSNRKFVHRVDEPPASESDCRDKEAFISEYGENIAILPRRMVRTSKSAADALMRSWLQSKDHRDNILNRDYGRIGMGFAWAQNGDIWVSQVFGLGQITRVRSDKSLIQRMMGVFR